MTITDKEIWENQSIIMCSRYYGALSDKQHASGITTAKDFLFATIEIAKEMFVILGGSDSIYLELVLNANSLSAPPYGIGGRNVLQRVYQYDENEVILKIADELQLSDKIKARLRIKPSDDRSLEESIMQGLRELLATVDIITPDLKNVLINGSKRTYITEEETEKIKNHPFSPEQSMRIAEQEVNMKYVIETIERDGVPGGGDPLMYILGTKERDFAQKI